MEIDCDLRTDWDNVSVKFEDTLADIQEITNDQQKSSVEAWYDVLKTLMRLWQSKDLKPIKGTSQSLQDAADDFYVFIYDEQDKNKQQVFKKGRKRVSLADE